MYLCLYENLCKYVIVDVKALALWRAFIKKRYQLKES